FRISLAPDSRTANRLSGGSVKKGRTVKDHTISILVAFAVTGLGIVAAVGQPRESALGTALSPVAIGVQEAIVESQWLMRRVLDNVGNKGRQGSGFNPLCYGGYPGKPIYSAKETGLNFEHIFNGMTADKAICMFTPRKDPVELIQRSTNSVLL